MKSSAFFRTLELAKMAAQIGMKEARSGNLKSRIEQATVLAEGLSQMKGAAMKAGQLLSLELVDYFPKEATEILSRLQNAATQLEFEKIDKIIRDELGPEKYQQLSSISATPIGSASIGQVHRAKLGGQDVVLKVQYPGVAESIDADLKILKTLANTFCALSGRSMDLGPLFREFRFILEQEVDYTREADLQERYRERAESLTETAGLRYVVPQIHHDLSSKRVLTMNYEAGQLLRPWMQRSNQGELRERLAHGVLNLYFHEFFQWGLVQTDPNQGNFLVREEGDELRLVLLDFGATRTYSREFIKNYVQLLQVTGEGDRAKLREQVIAFGLLDPRESDEAFEAMHDVLTVAVRPFFAADGNRLRTAPFDFSDESHARNSQQASRELAAKLKFSPPPHDLVFLHRKLGGVYAVLKSLGAKIDVSPYWQKMLEYGS